MKNYLKLIPFVLLVSCINVTKSDDKGVEVSVGKESKIKNGIVLEEHGLKVEQAFLLFEDKTLVPESNETNVNKKIKCRLIISGGWKEKDGKVFPGASELIETNTGEVILEQEDLFVDYTEQGVSAEDAQYITLTAVITSLNKLYDYFVVKFKVWDKSSDAYVTGSFKFKVK